MKALKIFIGLLVLIIPTQIVAQFNGFGIRGGLAASTTDPGISFNFYKEKGYNFAVLADFKISNHWFFQTELNLEQNIIFKDYIHDQLGPVFYRDITYNLNSLKIPVLINYVIGNKVKFYINSGFYLTQMISARKKGTFISSSDFIKWDTTKISTNAIHELNGASLGYICGLGLQIPVNQKVDLLIESRYHINFETVREDDHPDSRIDHLKSLVLNCGVKLKI